MPDVINWASAWPTWKWHMRPAKSQISLGIRPGWSESSLSTWRNLESVATQWAHSEDFYQTGQMPRLIWVFTERTCHFVGFVMRWLISYFRETCKGYLLLFRSTNKNEKQSFTGQFIIKRLRLLYTDKQHFITKTRLYNFDPLKPHFYIVKLGLQRYT